MPNRKAIDKKPPTITTLYRQFFEDAPYGCVLAEWDGTFVMVNPAFAKILRRTVSETLELKYQHFTPREYFEKDKMQLKVLKKKGTYPWFFKRYLLPDKSLVQVRLCLSRVVIAGTPYIWSLVEELEMRGRANLGRDDLPPEVVGTEPMEEGD